MTVENIFDLHRRRTRRDTMPSTPAGPPRPAGDLHPVAAATINTALQRLADLPRPWAPNSYWDTETFKAACILARLAHSHWSGYTLAQAEHDLYTHAPADERWGHREHEQKWKSALRTAVDGWPEPDPLDTPDAYVLRVNDEQAEVDTDDARNLDDIVRERLPILDWQQLWDDDTEEEWILEPLLPARRLVALYSPPKVGKSLLMLELAVAVATGSTALGTTPDRPRRVLYVDFENDPRADVRARLQAMGHTPADLDNLCYLSFPTLAGLDSEVGSHELMAAVQVHGCEVVVIDTVSRAVSGEENENDTWLAFYRHTGLKLKQAGVAMIRLDHTGKDEARGQRGGSAKVGDVDAVWKLSKVTESTFRLDCEHARMPVGEKTLVLHREALPHLHHRVDGAGRSAAFEATVNAVIDALDDAEMAPDTGRDRARQLLRTTGVKAGTAAIEEAIRRRKLDAGIYLLEELDSE